MQVSLSRRGGFAGLRPPAFVVDLAALPAAASRDLEHLVTAAKIDLPHLTPSATPQPDRFTYVLTLSGPSGTDERFEFDELAASPAVMALISAIQAAARKRTGSP